MISFTELHKQIQESLGLKIYERLMQLETMQHIFSMNFSVLNNFFSFMKDEKKVLELWRVGNRTKITIFHREYVRHIFNFLSSAKAYIDTTREIIKANYTGEMLKQSYDAKVSEVFAQSELCGFIQDFRNYHTHFEIPLSHSQLHLSSVPEEEPFSFKIYVEKQKLYEWSGWKSRAREYLAKASDKIDFENVYVEYFNLVNGFYDWLYNEIATFHQKELEEYSSLIEQMNMRFQQ